MFLLMTFKFIELHRLGIVQFCSHTLTVYVIDIPIILSNLNFCYSSYMFQKADLQTYPEINIQIVWKVLSTYI
jgi:hypothetical protein